MRLPLSRRKFLTTSAASVAVTSAMTLPASAQPIGANERINIGLIGTGGRCRHLMPALAKVPNTRMIAIISEKNPHALSAAFHFPEGADPYVMTRVKIAETSNVYALVQTDKGFFYTDQLVKVTLGGCGG